MVNVCTNCCGTIILLESFETESEAKNFMKNDYVLYEADEMEDGQEYLIHSDEMFLENEIPFFEKVNIDDWQEDDELPF